MSTTIMKQNSYIHFDGEWMQLITEAKNFGLSKEETLEFLQKNSMKNNVKGCKRTILTTF
jgi:hypothetical protein